MILTQRTKLAVTDFSKTKTQTNIPSVALIVVLSLVLMAITVGYWLTVSFLMRVT